MRALVLFASFFLATLCAAKPLVVSANTILADFVRAVGGDDIEQTCLVSFGADPHNFEPRPADLRKLRQAQLVVVNGFGLESWLTKVVENSGFHGRLLTASHGVHALPWRRAGESPTERTGTPSEMDPHVWHDPREVRHYAENIRDALAALDPPHAVEFAKNCALYLNELDALHQEAAAAFAQLPPERRKLVTSHDSFAYLARAYNLTIVPISGLNPDQEPSAKQLAGLVKLIRQEKVHAVFFEPTGNPKFVRLVADEAGVKVVRELYTDSLGPPGSKAATYLEMFRLNVETIVQALK